MVVDIGTGDGLFVYQSAKQNAEKLYIGVDANARPLEKISERIHRKPSRGGAPNALYLLACAEDLPEELTGVADEVYVLFPWGSLLHGVATGYPAFLAGLRRICKPHATLRIILSLDPKTDRTEINRLGLHTITIGCLAVPYREAGFELMNASSEIADVRTTWAKRLRQNAQRSVYRLSFRAM